VRGRLAVIYAIRLGVNLDRLEFDLVRGNSTGVEWELGWVIYWEARSGGEP